MTRRSPSWTGTRGNAGLMRWSRWPRRSRVAPADGQRPAPLFTVVIDHPGTTGRISELASRTVVTPGSLLSWVTDAYIERVVFDGNGSLKEVGPRGRFFRGRLRHGTRGP